MNNRKEMLKDYKQRKLHGGIYMITNTASGKYLIGHASDLKTVQNRFEFTTTTGALFPPVVHAGLQKDWQASGPQAFTFAVLEELDQTLSQTEDEFIEDLKILEQLRLEDFDASKAY